LILNNYRTKLKTMEMRKQGEDGGVSILEQIININPSPAKKEVYIKIL
jgi:hypothetical protein